ncbi:hypothetical protein RB653_006494 [Dictyostelium firmibasis]|uniref:Uncharacterized protein n=1 Tax=Dictyostelium firmibasis TaxID=79012 RepID=A0AAN7UBB8_9MYCE
MEPIPDISKLNINDGATTTTPNKKPQQNNKQTAKVALLTEEQVKKCLPILKCEVKDCNIQMNLDHFNNSLPIHMVVNKETNDFVIVKVDNQELEEYQLIYSVPKIQPFKNEILIQQQKLSSTEGNEKEETTIFTKFNSYYISNKWNGMNIQVFKYNGTDGKLYISAKPRASPFIQNDLKSGPIIDLINEIFLRDQIEITTENDGNYLKFATNFTNVGGDDNNNNNNNKLMVPKLIESLLLKKEKNIQSIVFELCGNKLPHIVKYDFDIDLKPLFTISAQGGLIKPIIIVNDNNDDKDGQNQFVQYVTIETKEIKEEEEENKKLIKKIEDIKIQLLKENKEFRIVNGLSENMIWFNHFSQEGRVLYLLNEQGTLINHRQIYSIKPKDTEKSHWEQFDNGIQSKLLMTIKEMTEKSITIDKENLRKELDLDQVSWNRHESDICSLVLPPVISTPLSKSKIVITCGLPACGKSYFSQAVAERSNGAWKRINQDDLGTRKKCEDLLKQYAKAGHHVIIDRCNQDIGQRRNWIKMAASFGVSQVHLIWFTIDQSVCKDRIVVRENHPTIPKGDEGIAIIDKFITMFVPPSEFEGFASLTKVSSEQESNDLIEKYISTVNNLNETTDA